MEPLVNQAIEYGAFTGLDLRKHPAVTPARALRRATNLDLLLGGAVRRRPSLRLICNVSTDTVGLYSSKGTLRTVCVGGQGLQDNRPAEVIYDPIGDGTAYALGSIVKLHAVEEIGSAATSGAYPYVVVERDNGRIEHHWCNANPALAITPVNTKVSLPFDPGKALLKSNNKLFADDPSTGALRYSSTLGGPTDWRTPRDAGALAVGQYASGSRQIAGLGYFRGQVAVQFKDATLLYNMNPDPAKFQLVTVLNGPGTELATATANVLGDLVYFSRGIFRSIATAVVTGEARESDIGAYIAKLTRAINVETATAVSLWSQARSQYLCAFGSTVYAMTFSPVENLRGWTTWELPVTVDALVEHNGDLYIRSGVHIYLLDYDQVKDFGNTNVDFDFLSAYTNNKRPAVKKRWVWYDAVQDGACQVNFQSNTDDEDEEDFAFPIDLDGTTYPDGHIGVNVIAENLAVRITGSDIWRLDSFTLHGTVLNGAG